MTLLDHIRSGKPVTTRDGREVRVYTTEGARKERPIVGEMFTPGYGGWSASSWATDGVSYPGTDDDECDLIPAPEPERTVYVNVSGNFVDGPYGSPDEAMRNAGPDAVAAARRDAAQALNYVYANTYCGADAEWHFKPGYDPQVVIDALSNAPAEQEGEQEWLARARAQHADMSASETEFFAESAKKPEDHNLAPGCHAGICAAEECVVCAPSPARSTAVEAPWRVGRRVGRNIYFNDHPVCMVETNDLAANMVRALNAGEAALRAPSEGEANGTR